VTDPKRINFCHIRPDENDEREAAEQMCEDCFIRWLNGEPFVGCDLCPPPKREPKCR